VSGRSPGADGATPPSPPPSPPPPDAGGRVAWFLAEPPLPSAARATVARLVRRARASWPLWVAGAVLLAAALTLSRARAPASYEVTIVLRVVEGIVDGPALSEAEIQAQVEDLAFTKDRLLGLLRKHVVAFPNVLTDQSAALDDLHERMSVTISEDDFIEDRQPTDPRRSARVTMTFRAPDPELAWTMANELEGLLVDSGLERQRETARREQEGAAAAQRRAESDVSEAQRESPGGRDKRLEAARARLLAAQQGTAETSITARAAASRLALRFDVIDPGRVPPRVDRRALMTSSFATTLTLGLLALGLLAGAYDPRVLDLDDLAGLGLPVLGRVPALGAARDGERTNADADGSGPRRRRV
jgi:hypothetical protein